MDLPMTATYVPAQYGGDEDPRGFVAIKIAGWTVAAFTPERAPARDREDEERVIRETVGTRFEQIFERLDSPIDLDRSN